MCAEDREGLSRFERQPLQRSQIIFPRLRVERLVSADRVSKDLNFEEDLDVT